jgi:hypothetical protein
MSRDRSDGRYGRPAAQADVRSRYRVRPARLGAGELFERSLVLRSRDGSDVLDDTELFGWRVLENLAAADAREFVAPANVAPATLH